MGRACGRWVSPRAAWDVGVVEAKQTRRRGATLEQAILDAAWVELGDSGWSGFTMDGVATRAGTARSVIYRRYRSRVDLAEAMLSREATSRRSSFVTTGSLRQDLVTFLEAMGSFLHGPFGAAVAGVVAEGPSHGRAGALSGRVAVAELADIVRAALDRGELSTEPSAMAVNLGHAIALHEYLQTGASLTPQDVASFVDEVWLPSLAFAGVTTAPAP